MATPVIDLRTRLRGAGFDEGQADAVAAGFEALERRMLELERRLDRIEWWQRAHGLLLGLILAAVVAPYVSTLFGSTTP